MKPEEKKQKCPPSTAAGKLYRSIRKVIEQAHGFISIAANTALIKHNWEIGRLIVEDEQGGKRKAEYGKTQLATLAKRLTMEYGNGYTLTNLKYMRQFYLAFPIGHALRDELSWTHYRILMRVTDENARVWYMNECVACGWGTANWIDRFPPRRMQGCFPLPIPTVDAKIGNRRTRRCRKYRNHWFRRISSEIQ